MVIAVVMVITLIPAQAFAAPKVLKTRSYNGVVKSGLTAYVAGANGLYKVWLNKNGSVRSKKMLRKHLSSGRYSFYSNMRKQGNFIYLNEMTNGTPANLIRINVNTGKRQYLAHQGDGPFDYAIHKNKIYYKSYDNGKNYVMNMDGKRKRTTATRVSMSSWASTTKGYYAKITKNGDIVTTYLKTPRGLYKLGTNRASDFFR